MGIWIIHLSSLMILSWIAKRETTQSVRPVVYLSTRRLVHPLTATDLPTRKRNGNQ